MARTKQSARVKSTGKAKPPPKRLVKLATKAPRKNLVAFTVGGELREGTAEERQAWIGAAKHLQARGLEVKREPGKGFGV